MVVNPLEQLANIEGIIMTTADAYKNQLTMLGNYTIPKFEDGMPYVAIPYRQLMSIPYFVDLYDKMQ